MLPHSALLPLLFVAVRCTCASNSYDVSKINQGSAQTSIKSHLLINSNETRLVSRGYDTRKDPFARSAAREYAYSIRVGNDYDIDGKGGSWINTSGEGTACKCTNDFNDPCDGEETVYFSNGCSKCFEYSRERNRIRGRCATALTHDAFKLALYAVRQPEQATPLLHSVHTNYVAVIWFANKITMVRQESSNTTITVTIQ